MEKWKFEFTDKRMQGNKTEDNFIKVILSNNKDSIIVKATTDEDRNEHWDYKVNGKKIDVKARKNIGILNLHEDLYTILEIQDIYGRNGWLYGKADYIAFEIQHFFLVCPRLELVKYHEANTKNIFVSDLNECINKKYQRFGAQDIITVVPFSEIQIGAYLIK